MKYGLDGTTITDVRVLETMKILQHHPLHRFLRTELYDQIKHADNAEEASSIFECAVSAELDKITYEGIIYGNSRPAQVFLDLSVEWCSRLGPETIREVLLGEGDVCPREDGRSVLLRAFVEPRTGFNKPTFQNGMTSSARTISSGRTSSSRRTIPSKRTIANKQLRQELTNEQPRWKVEVWSCP